VFMFPPVQAKDRGRAFQRTNYTPSDDQKGTGFWGGRVERTTYLTRNTKTGVADIWPLRG